MSTKAMSTRHGQRWRWQCCSSAVMECHRCIDRRISGWDCDIFARSDEQARGVRMDLHGNCVPVLEAMAVHGACYQQLLPCAPCFVMVLLLLVVFLYVRFWCVEFTPLWFWWFSILMQSYPTRALGRRLQVDWTRDPREGPRVLMSLRVDFESMG